jgi:hypothetical protein
MLKNPSVIVGRAYVNERAGLVREVVEETNRYSAKYDEFDLLTARLAAAPFQACPKSRLARWADREARSIETARLHPAANEAASAKPPARQTAQTELELNRANMEQAAGNNAHRRWWLTM